MRVVRPRSKASHTGPSPRSVLAKGMARQRRRCRSRALGQVLVPAPYLFICVAQVRVSCSWPTLVRRHAPAGAGSSEAGLVGLTGRLPNPELPGQSVEESGDATGFRASWWPSNRVSSSLGIHSHRCHVTTPTGQTVSLDSPCRRAEISCIADALSHTRLLGRFGGVGTWSGMPVLAGESSLCSVVAGSIEEDV